MSKHEQISIPRTTEVADNSRAQYAAAGRMSLEQLTPANPAPSATRLITADLTGLGHFAARA